ncbi:hypothetical protein BH09BAC2_BH09BAC2_21280 [soil metagenome]
MGVPYNFKVLKINLLNQWASDFDETVLILGFAADSGVGTIMPCSGTLPLVFIFCKEGFVVVIISEAVGCRSFETGALKTFAFCAKTAPWKNTKEIVNIFFISVFLLLNKCYG